MREGWKILTLSEIGKVYNGNSVNKKVKEKNYSNLKEGFPYIATKDISYESKIDYDNGIKIPFEEKLDFKIALENTVLICAEGGSAGRKIGFTNREVCFGNKLFAISVIKNIESRYVYYYYFSSRFQKNFHNEMVGIIGGVSMNKFKKLEIPIPPVQDQQRIVAVLDKTFAAIDKAKANAEQNLKNAKELFESYLQNVFENKGEGWEEKTLKEVTTKIGSGSTPRGGKASYKEEGISLIRSMNVHDFEFRDKNLAFIDDNQASVLKNVTLLEDDVLLNITGASIARCCIVPKNYLPARVNQHVSIIRAKKEIINPIFLASLLTSKYFKNKILEIGEQGATRQAITKAQLENFVVSLPNTIEEQEKVIEKINTLSIETKKLEAIYQQKIADLEELKKSVLQKAFNGELKTEKELIL